MKIPRMDFLALPCDSKSSLMAAALSSQTGWTVYNRQSRIGGRPEANAT